MKFKKDDYILLVILIILVGVSGAMAGNIDGYGSNVHPKTKVKYQKTLVDYYAEQATSVVLITDGQGLGTGFFVDAYTVATAEHVVADSDEFDVYLKGNPNPYKGKVIIRSKEMDLALLTVETKMRNVPLKLTERRQQVGEQIYSIGHPYGLKWSMTHGIISHLDRKTINQGLKDIIQINAPINGGNSGGPVFNMRGEVIGVVSYGWRADGLSCIIPVKFLKVLL